MSECNLWKSIATSLHLQRIFCVSPFYLDSSMGKLKSSCATKLYSISVIVILSATYNIAIFHLNFIETFIEFVPSGFVWQILCYFAFFSMNIHFILNELFIWIGYKQQMEFLERIHAIDKKIQQDFNSSVDHKTFKFRLKYTVIALAIYYGIQFTGESSFVIRTRNYLLIPPTIAYCLMNLMSNAQMYAATSYLFLLERRYRLILTAYQKLHRNYIHHRNSGIINENIENVFIVKLREIFECFREITFLIALYNDIFGWIFANQIIKTFMMALIQLYFVFLTATDPSGDNGYIFTFGFLYLFVGDMIKVFMFVVSIHMVYAAVNNVFIYIKILIFFLFHYILSYQ